MSEHEQSRAGVSTGRGAEVRTERELLLVCDGSDCPFSATQQTPLPTFRLCWPQRHQPDPTHTSCSHIVFPTGALPEAGCLQLARAPYQLQLSSETAPQEDCGQPPLCFPSCPFIVWGPNSYNALRLAVQVRVISFPSLVP